MARKRKPYERKLRTREHIIADLSVIFVERKILLRGYSVDEPKRDYGIDLSMSTYNINGEIEAGSILFQIKATDSLKLLKDGHTISLTIQIADLKTWKDHWEPIILLV